MTQRTRFMERVKRSPSVGRVATLADQRERASRDDLDSPNH